MLIPLQVIDPLLFTFFSLRRFDYAPQKMFQFENQALTNHFNLRF